MLSFNEALLQFIWQHRLLKPVQFYTNLGNEVRIVHPGSLNRNAGPDFFNAQIRLGGIALAGNVELHLRSSDWLRHRHDRDRSYDRIILHVVYEHDLELQQNTDHSVEVLELKPLIDQKTLDSYAHLAGSREKLACSGQLPQVSDLHFTAWLERMAIERLEEKTARIERWFAEFQGDYTRTFYTALLRSFGFGVNAVPFELVARRLPVQLLLKHADNLTQLEALLLGISGLLENELQDKYLRGLQNEFEFLRHKYTLSPLSRGIFKFSRLRPANFPTVRLAQLAALVHHNSRLISAPQEFGSRAVLMAALGVPAQGYWKQHYTMDGAAMGRELCLGSASAESLIINAFAPFLFFYSKKLGKPALSDLSLQLLQGSAFEANMKSRLFTAKKSLLATAADSQGLIHLYDHYCSKKQCLKCGIAASVLRSARLSEMR